MMKKKLAWFFLPVLGTVCIWAVFSESDSFAERGENDTWTIESNVTQALKQNSFRARDVQEISMVFWTEEDCAAELDCFANNPYNVYGLLARPYEPEDKRTLCTKQDLFDGICTPSFQLSGGDVIVLVGKTISDARYFNFLLNQVDRWVPGIGRERTESSIGLGINHLTLNHYGQGPFDGSFVMIVSASTSASEWVKNKFIDHGVPPGMINEYYFHRDFANGNLGDTADKLNFIYRISCAEDAALETYIESMPLKAFLIQDEITATGDVEQMEEWTPRQDSTELEQEDDLMTLIERIILNYWPEFGMPYKVTSESIRHLFPSECREEGASPDMCHWDNPDALYLSFSGHATGIKPHLNDENDFVVIAGINHSLLGLSNYFAYFLYPDSHRVGSPGFLDSEGIGSAQQYWPEAGNRFFAYKIGLNCEGDPWCLDISSLEQAIEPGEEFVIKGRIYLDPVSLTGPDAENFLPSVILWYKGN